MSIVSIALIDKKNRNIKDNKLRWNQMEDQNDRYKKLWIYRKI